MATNRNACITGEGIHLLPRLPELAGPKLHFNLAYELNQLRQKDSWKRKTGRSSKTLAKYPNLRVVLILMKAVTKMRQRRAVGRVSIQALSGMVRIEMADGTTMMRAGELLVLDCGVLHDVQALQESALLLSLSWPSQRAKARECRVISDQQLDNEALLRMDDEGGVQSKSAPSLLVASPKTSLISGVQFDTEVPPPRVTTESHLIPPR